MYRLKLKVIGAFQFGPVQCHLRTSPCLQPNYFVAIAYCAELKQSFLASSCRTLSLCYQLLQRPIPCKIKRCLKGLLWS